MPAPRPLRTATARYVLVLVVCFVAFTTAEVAVHGPEAVLWALLGLALTGLLFAALSWAGRGQDRG